jgi:hypothetical protein
VQAAAEKGTDQPSSAIGAKVQMVDGCPTLFIDGKPRPLICYRDHRPEIHSEAVEHFAQAGITTITLGINPAGRFDRRENVYRVLDDQARAVLAKTPGLRFLIIVNTALRARYEKAWIKEHPDEVTIWPPKMTPGDRAAEASTVWQEQLGREIEDLVRHVRQSDYANAVLGYFFTGPPGEWTDYYDFSRPALDGFRKWLKDQYGEVKSLKQAWHDKKVTFETAAIPDWDTFSRGDVGVFFDPQKSRRKIDFWRYHHSVPAQAIGLFARKVKEASGGQSLVGLFHGYFTDVEWDGNDAAPHMVGQFRMRHKSLAQIVEDPNVDFILAPYGYQERHAGGVFDPSLVPHTMLLHGKMAVVEDDTRTHRTTPHPQYQASEKLGDNFGQAKNLDESLAMLKRNFGGVFSRPGSGMWYFGLSDRGNEWFDDPGILGCIKTLARVAREDLLGKDHGCSQVAVIGSHRSACYQAFNNLSKEFVTRQLCENLHRLGAPFDLYLDTDLTHPRFPLNQYKLFIFLNTFYFNQQERSFICDKICADGRTVVWIWAPGMVDDEHAAVESVSKLTGIRLKAAGVSLDSARCIVTNYTSPWTQGLPTSVRFGPDRTERAVNPLLFADDPQAEVLGDLVATTFAGKVYTFRQPGLCAKRLANSTAIWSAVPNLPSCLLRGIARSAGVHIYDDGDDQVMASQRLLAVHGRYAGERTIRLPEACGVYDPFEEKEISRGAKEFRVQLPAGGTGLWILRPAGAK